MALLWGKEEFLMPNVKAHTFSSSTCKEKPFLFLFQNWWLSFSNWEQQLLIILENVYNKHFSRLKKIPTSCTISSKSLRLFLSFSSISSSPPMAFLFPYKNGGELPQFYCWIFRCCYKMLQTPFLLPREEITICLTVFRPVPACCSFHIPYVFFGFVVEQKAIDLFLASLPNR